VGMGRLYGSGRIGMRKVELSQDMLKYGSVVNNGCSDFREAENVLISQLIISFCKYRMFRFQRGRKCVDKSTNYQFL
jgi:hypothetical protein